MATAFHFISVLGDCVQLLISMQLYVRLVCNCPRLFFFFFLLFCFRVLEFYNLLVLAPSHINFLIIIILFLFLIVVKM